jgi:hypothetical protein
MLPDGRVKRKVECRLLVLPSIVIITYRGLNISKIKTALFF